MRSESGFRNRVLLRSEAWESGVGKCEEEVNGCGFALIADLPLLEDFKMRSERVAHIKFIVSIRCEVLHGRSTRSALRSALLSSGSL